MLMKRSWGGRLFQEIVLGQLDIQGENESDHYSTSPIKIKSGWTIKSKTIKSFRKTIEDYYQELN